MLPFTLPANTDVFYLSRARRTGRTEQVGRDTNNMATDDRGVNQEDSPQGGLLSRNIFSTDHKTIGLNYLWLALFSVFLGMAMSLLMRIHLVWPGVHLPLFSRLGDSPGRFAALTTLHGSLMVFLVLTAGPPAGFCAVFFCLYK